MEIIPYFPDDSIDFVFTSPPYFNINKKYATNLEYLDNEDLYVEFLTSVFKELYPKLKKTGSVVLNLGPSKKNKERSMYPFKVILKLQEYGYKLYELLIWDKLKSIPVKGFSQRHEYLFILVKDLNNFYVNWDELRVPYDESTKKRYNRKIVKEYRREERDKVEYKYVKPHPKGAMPKSIIQQVGIAKLVIKEHFAIFPEELVEYFLKGFSGENDVVLDPFMGSATTGVVANKYNRKFVGIDISKKYCEIAVDRLLGKYEIKNK